MKKPQNMFSNPVLEFLSLSGPIMMTIYHVVMASTIFTWGVLHYNPSDALLTAFLLVAGYFSWTLAEYLLHRFLFHWVSEVNWVKKFHYAMHGYHHETPHDHKRLFMPPVPVTLFVLFFFGFFYLISGTLVWFILPGFELGYLTYALCHYLVHTKPKAKLVARLSHHHILHHYKYPDKAYGVTTRIWDRIFGTMPPKIKAKAS